MNLKDYGLHKGVAISSIKPSQYFLSKDIMPEIPLKMGCLKQYNNYIELINLIEPIYMYVTKEINDFQNVCSTLNFPFNFVSSSDPYSFFYKKEMHLSLDFSKITYHPIYRKSSHRACNSNFHRKTFEHQRMISRSVHPRGSTTGCCRRSNVLYTCTSYHQGLYKSSLKQKSEKCKVISNSFVSTI